MHDSDKRTDPIMLNVSFQFAARWKAGPDGGLNTFPPGGGGLGVREVVIAPVDLTGKTASEITQLQARRARDVSLVAQAIAAAETQLADALDALNKR